MSDSGGEKIGDNVANNYMSIATQNLINSEKRAQEEHEVYLQNVSDTRTDWLVTEKHKQDTWEAYAKRMEDHQKRLCDLIEELVKKVSK